MSAKGIAAVLLLLFVIGGFLITFGLAKLKGHSNENPSTVSSETELITEVAFETEQTEIFTTGAMEETSDSSTVPVQQSKAHAFSTSQEDAALPTPKKKQTDPLSKDDLLKRYYRFLSIENGVEKTYAQGLMVEGLEGELPIEKDPNGIGFAFYDLDNDGMAEMIVCDGTYCYGWDDWYTVLIFKYHPQDDSVRYCGALHGYGDIGYSKKQNMIYMFPYRSTSINSSMKFYTIQKDTLQYSFSLVEDAYEYGTKEDGTLRTMFWSESGGPIEMFDVADYIGECISLEFINEWPETWPS